MAVGTGRGILGITQLFGSLGMSAKNIQKSSSDSGSGTEGTEVLQEGQTSSDSGVGAESSDPIQATIPSSD
ncbi:MAG: hypothetical protein JSV90_05005, partial [Methanobacteriota archaeon]